MHLHLMGVHLRSGAVELGLVVDGYLDGVVTALKTMVGREAAWKMLQRHADEVALEALRPEDGGANGR